MSGTGETRMMVIDADREVRAHYRLRLSNARASALADAEGAETVIFAIEAFGRYLAAKSESLEQIGKALVYWYSRRVPKRREQFERRLALLRRGRNDHMHKGFAARNLARDAVAVALMLEDALKIDWARMTATDVMTPSPATAHAWMTFGQVRDLLIENSFSQVPIWWDSAWFLISDRRVAEVVRRVRLAHTLTSAADLRDTLLESRHLGLGDVRVLELLTEPADTAAEDSPVLSLSLERGCVLVHRVGVAADLVGIITPSDIA